MGLLWIGYTFIIFIWTCKGQNSIPDSCKDVKTLPLVMPGSMCEKVGPVRTPLSDEDPCQKCSCSYGFVLCKKDEDCKSGSNPKEPDCIDQRIPKIEQKANQLPITPPEEPNIVPNAASEETNQLSNTPSEDSRNSANVASPPECFGEGTLPQREDKRCLDCECHKEKVHCVPTPCPTLPPENAECKIIQKPDSCCPELVCSPPSSNQTSRLLPNVLPDNPECFGEGALPPREDKHCLDCVCISGVVHCINQTCPELNNMQHGCNIIKRPGVCCPELECGSGPFPSAAAIKTEGVQVCIEGEIPPPPPNQPCSDCICINGEVSCKPIFCPLLRKPTQNCQTIKLPGHCCSQIICRHNLLKSTTTTPLSVPFDDNQVIASKKITHTMATNQFLHSREPKIEITTPDENLIEASQTVNHMTTILPNVIKTNNENTQFPNRLITSNVKINRPLKNLPFTPTENSLSSFPPIPLMNSGSLNTLNFETHLSTSELLSSTSVPSAAVTNLLAGSPCTKNDILNSDSSESCQLCKCIKGVIKCIQNPCPPIQPLPGCILQKRPEICCPSIVCEAVSPPELHPNSLLTPDVLPPAIKTNSILPPVTPSTNPPPPFSTAKVIISSILPDPFHTVVPPIFPNQRLLTAALASGGSGGSVGGMKMYAYPGSNINEDNRNPVSRWRSKYGLPYRSM